MKTKINSFMMQFKSALTGDNAGVQSEKAWRQASSAINAQIYLLKGEVVGLENNVDRANEALVQARVNGGKLIENNNSYIENLLSAKNNVTLMEEELEDQNLKIEFLELELKALSVEVEE